MVSVANDGRDREREGSMKLIHFECRGSLGHSVPLDRPLECITEDPDTGIQRWQCPYCREVILVDLEKEKGDGRDRERTT